jgi:hypothetical protein
LRQEYTRFSQTWTQVQEHAKAEGLLPKGQKEGLPVPTWEEWLKQNELVKEVSQIMDANGAPIIKE